MQVLQLEDMTENIPAQYMNKMVVQFLESRERLAHWVSERWLLVDWLRWQPSDRGRPLRQRWDISYQGESCDRQWEARSTASSMERVAREHTRAERGRLPHQLLATKAGLHVGVLHQRVHGRFYAGPHVNS